MTPSPASVQPKPTQIQRLNRAFGPVVAGLIIDFVDLATFGPIGRYLGFPIGAFAGYWMGRALGLDRKPSLVCALLAGAYCMMPGTEMIPLATVVGALARYRESAPKPDAAPSDPRGQP